MVNNVFGRLDVDLSVEYGDFNVVDGIVVESLLVEGVSGELCLLIWYCECW